MNKDLKRLILQWVSDSVINGLSRIVAKSNASCVVYIWLLCIATSTIICCFHVTSIISSYLSYEVITKIHQVEEIPTTFPQVTICNFNAFTTDEAVTFVNRVDKELGNFSEVSKRLSYLVPFVRAANLTDAEKKRLGYTFKEMIVGCMFRVISCDEDDFDWFYMPLYGNCFIFNSGRNWKGQKIPIKSVTQKGNYGALSLKLFIGSPRTLRTKEIGTGAVVFIGNHTKSPLHNQPTLLAPIFRTTIAITRTVSNKLSHPYSGCHSENEKIHLFEEFKQIFNLTDHPYYYKACKSACFSMQIFEECRCWDPELLSHELYDQVNLCWSIKEITCMLNSTVKKSRICEMHCPEDCHTETYDTGISSALFPKETYARNTLMTLPPIFNRYAQEQVPLTYENLKTKVVAVDLFYSDMRYIEISEAGHTGVLGMVCQLGGVFGLFLGMSLLSFVDLIELVVRIIYFGLKKVGHLF